MQTLSPRVLQFGKFYPPDIGGIESVMQDLCEGLNARGLLCDVLCSNSRAVCAHDILPTSARIYRAASLGRLASTSISPQLISLLRTLIAPYDIIHTHLPDPMANLALFCANLQGKILILHWHSDIIKQKYLRKLYAPLQSWLLRRADYIIATSPKYLRESPFLRPYQSKCLSIPIGIDTSLLHKPSALDSRGYPSALASSTAPTTASAPLPRGKKILFSLGRLAENKGFPYLIESARYLHDDYVVCIGGDGALKPHLTRLIAARGLKDRVLLLGAIPREALSHYYKSCHIFILPSIQESYGVVLLEAMSFGKPLISTRLTPSGVDWVNQHNTSGLVVPARNPRAIAEAVRRIERDYHRFSEGARARFLGHFTREAMLDSMQSLYLQAYERQGAKIRVRGGQD